MIVVGALTTVALTRPAKSQPGGTWELFLIETPVGSFIPEDTSWIEFDDTGFHGTIECWEIDGFYRVDETGLFEVDGWGVSNLCDDEGPEFTQVFERYFDEATVVRVGGGMTLQSQDASVQFSFTR